MTTSKQGFTKGPWIMDGWSITGQEAADSMGARSGMYGSTLGTDDPRHCIIAQRDGKVCVAMAFGLDLDHAKANARMLASAPELYELLNSAAAYIEALESFTGYNLEVLNWHKNGDTAPFDGFFDENRGDFDLAKARAALARAAGEGE